MSSMQAMVFDGAGRPLRLANVLTPVPGPREVLLRVLACGVCRTDLHILDGELPRPKLPLVLGHEIIGTLVGPSPGGALADGSRVGVPWLAWSCGQCSFCV